MNRVAVKLFAGAAEAFGSDEVVLEAVPDLAALITRLGGDDEELRLVLGKCSFFVDGEHYRDLEVALGEDCRVDVLPPFAGG